MPGETDSMYMIIPVLSEKGPEMNGDAMGGPLRDEANPPEKMRDEIIIGFVYACLK